MRALRAGAATLLSLMLAACGSDLHVRLFVSINAASRLHTQGAFIVLSGVAALPAGSFRDPGGGCRPGVFTIVWSNDSNGSHGHALANWHCPADALEWRSGQIPLVPGMNSINVTMADELGSAGTAIVVTRTLQ